LNPGCIFTCGNTATQRGESVNSALKEKGEKKKELRKFNLNELLEHILCQFGRLQARSIGQICDLIKANKRWSPYVEGQWKQQFSEISDLPFAREVSPGIWEVSSSKEFSTVPHCITRFDSTMFDIPTCHVQISSLLGFHVQEYAPSSVALLINCLMRETCILAGAFLINLCFYQRCRS
jgi:hypothetical protein